MRTTIKEAEANKRDLTIEYKGNGFYAITAIVRGKRKSCITTNSKAVDDFLSQEGEICEKTLENRKKRGYTDLLEEIIYNNF